MTQRQSFAVLVLHAVVALSILLAATVLCYSGKLDASAVVGLFGTAIALVGVSSSQFSQQVTNGGPKPDYTKLALSNPDELARVLAGQRGEPPQPYPASDAPPAQASAEGV